MFKLFATMNMHRNIRTIKESLKKSISEKENRILDLQIQSKEANRKRILADYFSQILSYLT